VKSFFSPASIAVVGASDKPNKAGTVMVKNLRRLGYAGAVYPVNPRLAELSGYRCYPSLDSVPAEVETAVIAVPRQTVPEELRKAARKGVRAVVVATAGFADAGDELGRALNEEIRRIRDGANFRLMGPNSIGTLSPAIGFTTSITTLEPLPPGPVAVFGQSGMFASGFARELASEERFGVSRIACLGNKLDVAEPDILEWLLADPETRVAGMYLEGARDGEAFRRAASRLAREKPLVALKSGKSELGRAAAAGHTGTMAGEDAVFAGLLRQLGVERARDFEDFFDLLEGFARLPLPAGDRVGVVSITGVGCVLWADAAAEEGLRPAALSLGTIDRAREVFPDWAPVRNPVDMWSAIERRGVEAAYHVLSQALLDDPGVDALLCIFTLIPESEFDAGALFEELRQRRPEKPLLACLFGGDAERQLEFRRGLRRAGVPVFPSPARAMRVLGALRRRASRNPSEAEI
jgi:acyl-CoA synthetase (NDP forming)